MRNQILTFPKLGGEGIITLDICTHFLAFMPATVAVVSYRFMRDTIIMKQI